MRLQGTRLIAFNEITHKPHAILELAQAERLEDPEATDEPSTPANTAATPSTATSSPPSATRPKAVTGSGHRRTLSMEDDDDPFSARPHSFRLVFTDESFVDFFADDGEEKLRWLRVLKPIVNVGVKKGMAGPPPVWAQVLKQMNKQKAKMTPPAAATATASVPPVSSAPIKEKVSKSSFATANS